MPNRDLYHQAVLSALISEGWVITDDPYFMIFTRPWGSFSFIALLWVYHGYTISKISSCH